MIHVPERSESTISVAGRTLYFDSSWNVLQNKRLRGVVVACPEELGDSYLLSRKGFTPGRVPVSAIQDRLRVGDEVYFDHTVTEEAGRVKQAPYELADVGGVYRANVNQLVARVREGAGGERVLEPYGSYVLLRECWPDDVQEMEVLGLGHKLHLRVSASGLALGSENIPPLPYQGEVAHVGLPLRGQPCRVQVGDRVVVDRAMCGAEHRPLKMKMEGEEYLCIRHDYIHAVLREAAPAFAIHEVSTEKIDFELNGERRWASKEDWQKGWAFRQQQMRRLPGFGGPLVTTCCGAESYTKHPNGYMEGGEIDYCKACKQVAHLVPAAEFSTNKPAA